MNNTIQLKLNPIDKEYIAKAYGMLSRLSMWADVHHLSEVEKGRLYDAQAVLLNWYVEWEDESVQSTQTN